MSKIKVERKIKINAPVEVVYPAVNDFHKWIEWSPWLLMEPEAKVEIADDKESYSWDGKRLGSGNMYKKTVRENEYVDFDLNFIKPWKSSNTTSLSLRSVDGGTEVVWTMNSSLPFYLFWMKNMMIAYIGSDYDRGLNMLKAYVEQGEIYSKLEFVGPAKFDSCNWVGVNTSCAQGEMPEKMESDFSRIHSFVEENKDIVTGPPFTMYKKWDLVKGKVEYIACIPVSEIPSTSLDGFVSGVIPSMNVHKLRHIGAYKHLGNAWSTGQAMMRNKEFKHMKNAYPFEVYLNDPSATPEKDLITDIHFPVK